jgi:paraquat-inducible protein A
METDSHNDETAHASWANNQNAATLAVLSQTALALAVFLPFMSITTFGREETYSLLGGVIAMLHSGQRVLAGVIFISSVVFPLAKNGLILSATSALLELPVETREWLHDLAAKTAKYSMLDVFVVAVLVVVLKVGDMTEVTVGSGTFLFLVAIALSMLASACVRLKEEERE